MTQYEYLMKMKDISETAGHKHPDLMPFFAAAAETFENRAKDLPMSDATASITKAQTEYLANHINMELQEMNGRFGKTIKEKWALVEAGKMTREEFIEWKKEFEKGFTFICHPPKDCVYGPGHPNEGIPEYKGEK